MSSFGKKNVVLLAVAVALGALITVLIVMTLNTARDLEERTNSIAENSKAVEDATASISKLEETNSTARSILGSAEQLPAQLTELASITGSINTISRSIAGTTTQVVATTSSLTASASAIETDSAAINQTTGGILTSTREVNNLSVTLEGTAGQLGKLTGQIAAIAGELTDGINDFQAPLTALDSYLTKGK